MPQALLTEIIYKNVIYVITKLKFYFKTYFGINYIVIYILMVFHKLYNC